MRTVYAVQFEVNPPSNQTANACFADLKQRLAEWVEQKYLRAFQINIKMPFDGRPQVPKTDHEVIGSSKDSQDWQYCSLIWTHPGDRDTSLLWCIESEIAQMQDALQFGLRVRISSRKPIVKPLAFELGKPRIVLDIIKSVSLYAAVVRVGRARLRPSLWRPARTEPRPPEKTTSPRSS